MLGFIIFLLEIRFLNLFQSGFRPTDSIVNQLVFIVHKIVEALEQGKEVAWYFWTLAMPLDKVCHKGLLRKLKSLRVKDGSLTKMD